MSAGAGTWWHEDGTECVAGHQDDTGLCTEGGGIVHGDPAAAQVARVRTLHSRHDRPVRSYDRPCDAHAFQPDTRTIGSFTDIRACPDCKYSEYWVCSHCECPNDAWPCPTIRALEGGGAFLAGTVGPPR